MKRLVEILILLLAAGAADAMTVRSKGDPRLWQTVFDREAPLAWVWEAGSDSATVTFRPVRATRDDGDIVATRYGAARCVDVARTPTDSRRGSCAVPSPLLSQGVDSLVEVSLVQTSNAVEVARATVRLAYPLGIGVSQGEGVVVTRPVTLQAKANRDWRRVVVPRASGFDAAWWNVAGSSGYEVFWSNRKGSQPVTREFATTGVVDTASLIFGTAGFCIMIK